MEKINLHEITQIIINRNDAFDTIWSFYVTIIIGIIAYIATVKNSSSSNLTRLILVIGFLLFSFANISALDELRSERSHLTNIAFKLIYSEILKSENISQFYLYLEFLDVIYLERPPDQFLLWFFHITADLLMVALIWFVPVILTRERKLIDFVKGEMSNIKSPFKPVLISRNQITGIWTLERKYKLKLEGYNFTIPKGFTFDLASIPRILWWLIAPFELTIVGPLIHDYIYKFGGKLPKQNFSYKGKYRLLDQVEADTIFLKIMNIEGVPTIRQIIVYNAVRIFGYKFWRN